jgi:hypothetical protein
MELRLSYISIQEYILAWKTSSLFLLKDQDLSQCLYSMSKEICYAGSLASEHFQLQACPLQLFFLHSVLLSIFFLQVLPFPRDVRICEQRPLQKSLSLDISFLQASLYEIVSLKTWKLCSCRIWIPVALQTCSSCKLASRSAFFEILSSWNSLFTCNSLALIRFEKFFLRAALFWKFVQGKSWSLPSSYFYLLLHSGFLSRPKFCSLERCFLLSV